MESAEVEEPVGEPEAIEAESVVLDPVSIEVQPSRYIRGAYAGHAFGKVREVTVKVAESDGQILVWMSWADQEEDRAHKDNRFPDAAAVMFPLAGDAPIESMGSTDQPVSVWYWRPDLDAQSQELVAVGLGTVDVIEPVEVGETTSGGPLAARSSYDDGRWTVVLKRGAASTAADRVDVAPSGATKAGFAVWEGSAGERGGFKAASPSWLELERNGEGS